MAVTPSLLAQRQALTTGQMNRKQATQWLLSHCYGISEKHIDQILEDAITRTSAPAPGRYIMSWDQAAGFQIRPPSLPQPTPAAALTAAETRKARSPAGRDAEPGAADRHTPGEPGLTAPALRILAALADEGSAPCHLTWLAERAGVDSSTASHVARRLAATGWVQAATGQDAGRVVRTFRIAPGRLAAARAALNTARAEIARARHALSPGSGPTTVSLGSRVTGPGVAAALVIRAFLGTPGQPRYHAELAAHTGLPKSTLPGTLARLRAEGWIADAEVPASPPARTRGHPPRPLALTPAGRAAAPALLADARSHLAEIAQRLGAPGAAPER